MIAKQKQALEEVVRRLREYAGVQITGRALSSTELRWQEQLVQRLIARHMRPIVTIARSGGAPQRPRWARHSAFGGRPAASRLPRAL